MLINRTGDQIILAPMEGVVDAPFRQLLTDVGGIDLCVSEFIRVSSRLLPARTLLSQVPELASGGCTRAGVPVVVQLLGGDATLLAETASRLVELGALGIDLNFGCPSKTVNKRGAGALLLDEPEQIYRIVSAVRAQVPPAIAVSAKMRLGNRDTERALDNAQGIASAGANWMTVHARTRLEGYRPPAHWHWIARIRAQVEIPVVANGDIWNLADYQRCRQVSGSTHVMIGRGLIATPHLGVMIKAAGEGRPLQQVPWPSIIALLLSFYDQIVTQLPPRYVHGRIKQWLNMMRSQRPEAEQLFQQIKTETGLDRLQQCLLQQL